MMSGEEIRRRGAAAALCLAVAGLAGVVHAQEVPPVRQGLGLEEPDPPVTGEDLRLPETAEEIVPVPPPEPPAPPRRPREEEPYAPLGLRAGAFLLFPVLEVDAVHSDNVNESPSAPLSDTGLRVAPALRLESDWVRHSLSLTAAGELIFYQRHPEFDDTALDAAAALRLDVRRDTTLDLGASYDYSEAQSSASEVPDTAIGPRVDQQVSVSAALGHRFSRLLATLAAEATWLFYGDVELAGGGLERNSDRNYVQPALRLRAGYEVSPALVPFAEAGYQPRYHEQRVDRDGVRRNSHGGFLRTGVALDVSEVWSGELALRLDVRDYDDPSLGTATAFGLDADLVWRPSRLTSVAFTASSGLGETQTVGASAIRNWTGRIAVTHALRDNLRLTGGLGLDYASYQGISLDEATLTADLAVSYLLSRKVEVVVGYTFTAFETQSPGGDYRENLVRAGLRFRL